MPQRTTDEYRALKLEEVGAFKTVRAARPSGRRLRVTFPSAEDVTGAGDLGGIHRRIFRAQRGPARRAATGPAQWVRGAT